MTEETVKIGEEVISLAELAGLDMGDVTENFGLENLPAGLYEFRIEEAKLESRDTQKGAKACVNFKMKVTNCISLIGDQTPDSTVDRIHFETFWLTELLRDLGRVKGFLIKACVPQSDQGGVAFQQLLDNSIGHCFMGVIKNTKSKNDSDVIFSNLDIKKVGPVA